MTVLIDQDGCIACGQCMQICPEVFKEGEDGKAYAAVEDLPPDAQNKAVEKAAGVFVLYQQGGGSTALQKL